MIIDSGNNPFYVSEHGKDPKNATNQKIEKQNSSSELPSSDVGPEDNDEIMFDFTRVEMELLREQSN